MTRPKRSTPGRYPLAIRPLPCANGRSDRGSALSALRNASNRSRPSPSNSGGGSRRWLRTFVFTRTPRRVRVTTLTRRSVVSIRRSTSLRSSSRSISHVAIDGSHERISAIAPMGSASSGSSAWRTRRCPGVRPSAFNAWNACPRCRRLHVNSAICRQTSPATASTAGSFAFAPFDVMCPSFATPMILQSSRPLIYHDT